MSTLQVIYSPKDLLALDTFCLTSTPEKYSALNPAKTSKSYIKNHPDVYDLVYNYMYKRYDDILESDSIPEILYRIKYNILKKPRCKSCNKILKFKGFANGYGIVCSSHCNMKCNEIVNKFKTSIYNKQKHYDLSIISEENDQYIINTYTCYKGSTLSIDGNKLNLNNRWSEKNPEIVSYVLNRFKDTKNIQEIIYRLCNKIEIPPVCSVWKACKI